MISPGPDELEASSTIGFAQKDNIAWPGKWSDSS